MRIYFTDEMRKLRTIYEPYLVNGILRKDAPQEAVDAEKKFMELFDKEKQRTVDLILH